MSYTKTNWQNGVTPVNSTNLNHTEQGIYDNSTNIGNLNNLNTTEKTNLVGAINEVNTNLSGTLLWTNSSPSSNWTSANVILSSSDYDLLEWYFRSSTTTPNFLVPLKIPKGENGSMIYYNPGASAIGHRFISRVDDTTYTVDTYVNIYGSGGDTGNRLIPMYVVGYKTGLFS